MLANTFAKTVRDRWVGLIIGATTVALFLLMGMAVYRDLDLSLYTDMPDAVRRLFGYSEAADAAGLAFGAIYSLYGAFTLAGIAISMGAASIAREERDGTIGLLLASPQSRTRLLASKAAAMVLLTAAGAVILWGAGHALAAMLDVDLERIHVGALAFAIFVNALFYGFLAMLIGAWTGNATAASGIAVAVMVVSYLAAGVLPFVSGLENVAKAFPWYYYDASQPVVNGVDWGHMAVLAVPSALFAGLAVAGVNRRDLKDQSVAVTLLDRLRNHPLTRKMAERLAGSARVSRIWVKAATDHQGVLIVTGYIILLTGVVMGPFYTLVDEDLRAFAEQLPDALMATVGFADLATPEGWYQTENFSFTLPVGLIIVTTLIGARALAGEESRRTMGLLLANPVSRSRVVVEKWLAMVLHAAVLGALAFAGTAAGSLLAGLDMSMANIAATSVLLVLIGMVFGGMALALSAATGRVKVVAFGTAGLTLAFFMINAFLPLSDRLAGYARWSPFHYYLTTQPLANGMPWGHAAVLTLLALAMAALSVVLFRRRDLRQVG